MLDGKIFPNLSCTPYVCKNVWWCHIDKKWPLFKHETHMKNNSTPYTSCLNEHMKARMLEVHMAMMGNQFFSWNQMPMTMAWMVYVQVVFGVQVDWKIVPSQWTNNVLSYRPNRFAMANLLALLEILPTLIIIPLDFITQLRIPHRFALVTSPFSF